MKLKPPTIDTPLHGIRMLDLGRYQAGPRCALMFARMGADVIKIETINGDESRKSGPIVNGQSAYWVQYNSGKKSLSVNLRTDEGKHILKELVKVSDIFLQNFRPGTIETMGFGYDILKHLNPRIIMINVSAYGQYGPYSERVGFDSIGQALGGLMSLTGSINDPPIRTFFPLIDRITALHATIGALAAIHEREISGKGQTIDVCLADTGFTVNEIPISSYLGDGTIQQKEGNGSGISNSYQTSDGWVYMTANGDNMWKRICDAMEHPEWTNNPMFITEATREEHVLELEKELAQWFQNKTTENIVKILSQFSIPCAPINSVEEAANDPHLHEREILVEVEDDIAGKIHVTGKTIKFGRTPMVVGSAPTIGSHSKEILQDILGYTQNHIQTLEDAGIINCGAHDNT